MVKVVGFILNGVKIPYINDDYDTRLWFLIFEPYRLWL